MAARQIHLEGIGDVAFYKRRGAKSVRLRVDNHNRVTVTMPSFMPYKLAEQFVWKHREWIQEEQAKRQIFLADGMRVGRVHILRFIYDATARKPVARVTASQVVVRHQSDIIDSEVQASAKLACIRALRREAQHFLPKRLADVANAEGYEYASLSIKQLKGRWGSCDHNKHITLNLFLMQLPVEYIDYVILHELAHTRALHHGPEFWQEFEAHLPNARSIKKQMKQYQPTIPATRS